MIRYSFLLFAFLGLISTGAYAEPLDVRVLTSSELPYAPAFLAVDRDVRLSWIPANSTEENWIRIELLKSQRISSVELMWQPGINDSTYTAEISENGSHWQTVGSGKSGEEKTNQALLKIQDKPSARYLRVKFNGPRQGISEIRINDTDLRDVSINIPEIPIDAPYRNRQFSPELRAANVVALMAPYEKFQFVGGYFMRNIRGLKRFGLRDVSMADASAGVHLYPALAAPSPGSIAYPSIVALAATWDVRRARDYGLSLGQECRQLGVDILLGPGVNLYRTSTCGRNFEYMGEDPVLAGQIATAYIQAMQSQGIVATAKHFACNNQEWNRHSADVIVDDRTLHEFYLLPWYYLVQKGHVGAIMGAYNLINGEKACTSQTVLNGLLRTDIGFQGLIMSDWGAAPRSELVPASGLDLSMPVTRSLYKLSDALPPEALPQLDGMVTHILTTLFRLGVYDREQKAPELADQRSAWETAAMNVARESITLLKNDGILPLKSGPVVVVGPSAIKTLYAGKGSGFVDGYGHTHIGSELQKLLGVDNVTIIEDWKHIIDQAIRNARTLIVCVDRQTREANDFRPNLDGEQEKLVWQAVTLNPRTIVVANSGSGLEMEWNENAAAVVWAYYPGQYGGAAIAEALIGKINPSGKLPYTIERQFKDSPAYGYIPDGASWVASRFGKRTEVDKTLPPNPPIEYAEGIFVGYRWYDKKNLNVRYPFGHGLSYTEFSYKDIKISYSDHEINIAATVTNTGPQTGMEAVQVYVGAENARVERPLRELKAYGKVELKPGESRQIEFRLTPAALAYYDTQKKNWRVEPGSYRIDIGASSRDIRLSNKLTWIHELRYARPTDAVPIK